MALQPNLQRLLNVESKEDSMRAGSDVHNPGVGGNISPKLAPDIDKQSPSQQKLQPSLSQRRKRVHRACDECHQEKVKCDGKQPCAHCIVYGYGCTYNKPSRRRRIPVPAQPSLLEMRLQRAEALLRITMPGLDLDDPRLNNASPEAIVAAFHQISPETTMSSKPTFGVIQGDAATAKDAEDEALLETMLENFGALDVDNRGHWDYHGHSSGIIFLQRLQNQFGNLIAPIQSSPKSSLVLPSLESPKSYLGSESDSEHLSSSYPTSDLPSEEVAKRLCQSTLEQACILLRFIHEPSFWSMFNRIYATPWDQFGTDEQTFLPQLYIALAIGCLFSNDAETILNVVGYNAVAEQGFKYFRVGQQLVNITDCRDLATLQSICFMILFLQSAVRLSTSYSYIGIAQRAALRLGLHRTAVTSLDPIEQDLRKRIFWVVRVMDTHVSINLGLPLTISNDDIDQTFPLEIDDEYITPAGIIPMPPGRVPFMAGANAQSRLIDITMKVIKYIYPVRLAKHQSRSDNTYLVSHSRIREIEKDLEAWMASLPEGLRPGDEMPRDLERMRLLLELNYAHIQWIMYRPFLHYVSRGFQSRSLDKRSYACAASCVSASQDVVRIMTDMHNKGLLSGSYWFVTHATYYSVLTLMFVVLEGPELPKANDDILKYVLEGTNTLKRLSKNSMIAERCSRIYSLFEHLPERLKAHRNTRARLVDTGHPMSFDTLAKAEDQIPTIHPITQASEIPINGYTLQDAANALDSYLIASGTARTPSATLDAMLPQFDHFGTQSEMASADAHLSTSESIRRHDPVSLPKDPTVVQNLSTAHAMGHPPPSNLNNTQTDDGGGNFGFTSMDMVFDLDVDLDVVFNHISTGSAPGLRMDDWIPYPNTRP